MLGHRHSCCFRKPVLSTPRANPRPQVKLKQTTPQTEEEKTEHSVAAERRRMRLLYADTIKDLLANCVIQDGERPWVGRAAGMLDVLCPRPPVGRGRKGVSLERPLTVLMALSLQSLLQGRVFLGLLLSSREP